MCPERTNRRAGREEYALSGPIVGRVGRNIYRGGEAGEPAEAHGGGLDVAGVHQHLLPAHPPRDGAAVRPRPRRGQRGGVHQPVALPNLEVGPLVRGHVPLREEG
eukprot:3375832-Pyramimonas_sp.AAC.1